MQLDETHNTERLFQFSEAVHPPSVANILTHLGLAEARELASLPADQLVAALEDHRWERRASAATAYGRLGKHAPVGPLLRVLEDGAEEVRAAAARALGHLENS